MDSIKPKMKVPAGNAVIDCIAASEEFRQILIVSSWQNNKNKHIQIENYFTLCLGRKTVSFFELSERKEEKERKKEVEIKSMLLSEKFKRIKECQYRACFTASNLPEAMRYRLFIRSKPSEKCLHRKSLISIY